MDERKGDKSYFYASSFTNRLEKIFEIYSLLQNCNFFVIFYCDKTPFQVNFHLCTRHKNVV